MEAEDLFKAIRSGQEDCPRCFGFGKVLKNSNDTMLPWGLNIPRGPYSLGPYRYCERCGGAGKISKITRGLPGAS